MEETHMDMAPRQLISFVLANSASCKKETLAALMGGFRTFLSEQAENAALEWELCCFDTFESAVVKRFDTQEILPVYAGRMPLLGRTVLQAAERVNARVRALREEGVPCYRPWMFILSDGFTFDELEEMVTRLDGMEHAGEMLYLPFKLSPELYGERIQSLDRVKHMIEIKDSGITGFFAFVNNMLTQRLSLPAEQTVKFQKSDFEGWAEL